MNKTKKYRTDFLFSTPNFFTGAGSVMNLAGNYYDFNTSENDLEADYFALKNDFIMIGQDLYEAIETLNSAR